MGLFDFLRKEDDYVPDLETHEVDLHELPGWFRGTMSGDIAQKTKQAEERFKELVSAISEIRRSLETLDQARLSGKEKLQIAANMIKESYAKKKLAPLNSLSSLYDGYRPEYRYFREFQERASQAVGELKASTPKQTILLSRYFKKESQALVDSIKKAEEASQGLREFLSQESGALGLMDRINSSYEHIQERLGRAAGLDRKAEELRGEIGDSKERRQELEKQYLKILKSREWKDINSMEKRVKEEKDALREAEMRLNSELSSLKRPLKEAEHALSRKGKLTPIQKNVLRDFIRDPLKHAMSEKGVEELQKALDSMARKAKSLELKGKEDLDLGDLATRAREDLPKLKEEHDSHRETLEKSENRLRELSKLGETKASLEKEIEKKTADAGRLDEELRQALSERSGIMEDIDSRLRDLENMILEKAQKRVKIRLSTRKPQ